MARNVATNSGLTQTGRFVGTLDYVAPEQISGGEVDARVDVYSKRLTEISKPAVRQFQALDPPASLRADYEAYVRAQERVKKYDRQALVAAERGDEAAYLEAREERNLQQSERHELAQEVGLKVCSAR